MSCIKLPISIRCALVFAGVSAGTVGCAAHVNKGDAAARELTVFVANGIGRPLYEVPHHGAGNSYAFEVLQDEAFGRPLPRVAGFEQQFERNGETSFVGLFQGFKCTAGMKEFPPEPSSGAKQRRVVIIGTCSGRD